MAGVADTLKTQLLEQWARLDPAYIQSVLNQSGLTLDQLATEFADQAQQAGITDLSALNTGSTVEKVAADDGSYDVVRNYLTAGDKNIGYIGEGDQRQYLDDPDALNRVLYPYAFKDTDPNQLGRVFGTAEGEGWTAGDVVRAPSGELLIVPSWGDSSDKRAIYKAVSALAAPIGGALTGPLSSALTPTLGATGANIATGAIIGSGTSALTGGNTEDILKGAVIGGVAGGVRDYFTPAVTDPGAVDSAVKALEDAYTSAGLPVDYAAIERSLVAQGFNAIDAGAAVDLARSTSTTASTAATTGQTVDVVGSKLADTSVLEALNLVPAGTFTSSATTATTTPTTVTQGTTTPTTTEQTVEVTAPTTPAAPAVVVPPVVTQSPTTVTTTPGTTEQTVTITNPRDLATAADVSALYNSLLGRAPDAAGLDFYSKNGFTIDEVRNDMLNSEEYRNRTAETTQPPVENQTVEVTGQNEPPPAVTPPVVQPPAEPPAVPPVDNQTVTITNPKNLATVEDVTALYNSLLGRAPDTGGLEFYTKNGFTIDEVRNDMLNSEEYKNKTTGTVTSPTGTQTVDVTGTREGTLTTVNPGTTLVQSTETFKPADVTVEDKKEGGDTGTTTTTTGTGDTTTTTTTTEDINKDIDNTNLVDSDSANKLPSWLTTDFLKALLTLGMLGGGGTGPGSTGTVSPGSLPTQGIPTPTTDYYNQVQQYYNKYMPDTPRDVSTPLQTWYGGSLFTVPNNMPTNTSTTTTTATGGMSPNIDVQAIMDFLNKYATQQD